MTAACLLGKPGRNVVVVAMTVAAVTVAAMTAAAMIYTGPMPAKYSFTAGSIPRALVAFSLPILFGNVLQSINGSVNAVWVRATGAVMAPLIMLAISLWGVRVTHNTTSR
jgi:hypothetical protein